MARFTVDRAYQLYAEKRAPMQRSHMLQFAQFSFHLNENNRLFIQNDLHNMEVYVDKILTGQTAADEIHSEHSDVLLFDL